MIHAITWGLVLTSGAGMSRVGPMTSWIWSTNLRVSRSISRRDMVVGSQVMPPFEPPKGRFTTAVFQVISEARATTSFWSSEAW